MWGDAAQCTYGIFQNWMILSLKILVNDIVMKRSAYNIPPVMQSDKFCTRAGNRFHILIAHLRNFTRAQWVEQISFKNSYLCNNWIVLCFCIFPFGSWHLASRFIWITCRWKCAVKQTRGTIRNTFPWGIMLREVRQENQHHPRHQQNT